MCNAAKSNLMNALHSAGYEENPDEILEVREFADRFIFMCGYVVGGQEMHFDAGEFFKASPDKAADFGGISFSSSLLKEEVKRDFDAYSV